MSALEKDGWRRKYRFERTPRVLSDFASGCAFHQSPESPFARGPVVSRITGDHRVTLRRDRVIHTPALESATSGPSRTRTNSPRTCSASSESR
ncbi:MAG: arylamine N-acetyltransferase [Deltaproteobacteria bacterium]|nr:arylamine N-acetyltransferase [Deltaproteobacteria bacterium]